MWVVAYVRDFEPAGWYVVELETRALLAGPYGVYADAVEAAQTRAYRLAQGWAP